MVIPEGELALNKLNDGNAEMLYVQIVDKIRNWMLKGYLREGDLLPSERELAELFGVSRMPVSQALKILEFLGVVQQVRGKGIFIKKIDINKIINSIGFMIINPGSGHLELFEARSAIEVYSAQLAAVRRTQEDLDILEDALLEMERNIQMQKDLSNASLRFHTALIAAAKNEVISKINEFLLVALRYSRQEFLRDSTQQDAALLQHKKIFAALQDADAERAGLEMQAHLYAVTRIVQPQ